jgi:hypothetical protein
VSESGWLDDALRHGVAIGDRDALHARAAALGFAEVTEAVWPPADLAAGCATDAIVRGMFTMLAQHVRSIDAQSAFAPLQLLMLLRGDTRELQAFVAPLDDEDQPGLRHLMLLRPAVFVSVGDRLLRAMTCAKIWPELGDLATCQREWTAEPLLNQPADPERFQLAMHMAMLAALVIFYHEMAHILRGHSAYLREASGFAGGPVVLREHRALAVTGLSISDTEDSASTDGIDLARRALEADADLHAGLFMAEVLKLDVLGEVNAENLLHWCELVAFVAAITYNAFEAHSQLSGYRAGYHLPPTRMECFLEGVARGLGVNDGTGFAAGADAAFAFCAQHYEAPANLDTLRQDTEALLGQTWPTLARLTPLFSRHVPPQWLDRSAPA